MCIYVYIYIYIYIDTFIYLLIYGGFTRVGEPRS